MDYFSKFKIQPKAKDYFKNSIENNRLAHAYLFYGPEGTGKDAFALELAKALNCQNDQMRPCYTCPSCEKIAHFHHPDIHYIFPIMKSIGADKISEYLKRKSANPYISFANNSNFAILIDQIRQLKNESKYTPHEAQRKVYIVSNADRMNNAAANSFLKILEEPPDQLSIILTSSNLNAIPVTIRSRCHIIYFPMLNYKQAEAVVGMYMKIDDSLKELILLNENNLNRIFNTLDQEFGEKNRLVYDYIRYIAGDDMFNLTEIVEKMTAARDRNYLLDLLNLLILWFKDVFHLANLQDESKIINSNLKENIINFTRIYGNSNIEAIVDLIDRSIYNLQHNANGKIVLTVLGFRIREYLFKTELKNVT